MVAILEDFVFRYRIWILILLGIITAVMGYYASQLRMDAGFAKQLPREHEYIKTFFEYQDRLFGSNRVMIVLRAREGDIPMASSTWLGSVAPERQAAPDARAKPTRSPATFPSNESLM